MKNLKNILLSLASVFLMLLLLECVLFCAGKIYSAYRIGGGRRPQHTEGTIKILCLGDSYTFGAGAEKGYSYPEQLEKKLNAGNEPAHFAVYNGGVCGATSTFVLKRMEGALEKYNPDILIILVGHNETAGDYLEEADYHAFKNIYGRIVHFVGENARQLKTFKLVRWIRAEVLYSFWKKRLLAKYRAYIRTLQPRPNNIKEPVIDARQSELFFDYLWTAKKYLNEYNSDVRQASEYYRRAIAVMPDNEEGHLGLAYAHLHINELEEAITELRIAERINPGNSEVHRLLWIAYYRLGNTARAKEALEHYLALAPREIPKYIPLLQYGFLQADEKEVIQRVLAHNLGLIIKRARARKIKVILQDYPFDEWSTTLIENVAREHRVPFVCNSAVFEKLKLRDGYRQEDYFAVDLHCKNKGYALIAENLYPVVIQEALPPQRH